MKKGKTAVPVPHDAQLLLNKQQQIRGSVYIHWHFSTCTDTVILPERVMKMKMMNDWAAVIGLS